jgi:hypothetical protein
MQVCVCMYVPSPLRQPEGSGRLQQVSSPPAGRVCHSIAGVVTPLTPSVHLPRGDSTRRAVQGVAGC